MKKYSVIYADPPWQYNNKSVQGGAEHHYPTMPVKDICALPVSEIAEDDAILFMWVTFPTLIDAFKVIEAWGFKYKTLGFAWIKTNRRQDLSQTSFLPTDTIDDFFGIGHYTKSNCEVCLIATRGKAKKLVASKNIASTIIAPRGRHSAKPAEARERIERLVHDGLAKVELFCREPAEGWDVWGNEVESTASLDVVK